MAQYEGRASYGPPTILDSGHRQDFTSGAVRDMSLGKGRCDLLPLVVVSHMLDNEPFLICLHEYLYTGDTDNLYTAISNLQDALGINTVELILEVAIHFEQGALKYSERNWEKGIPIKHYIDSAIRHWLKFMNGNQDEPHDRAAVWNIMCAIWTHDKFAKPEIFADLPFYEERKVTYASNRTADTATGNTGCSTSQYGTTIRG